MPFYVGCHQVCLLISDGPIKKIPHRCAGLLSQLDSQDWLSCLTSFRNIPCRSVSRMATLLNCPPGECVGDLDLPAGCGQVFSSCGRLVRPLM